jgi:hypothetical protein
VLELAQPRAFEDFEDEIDDRLPQVLRPPRVRWAGPWAAAAIGKLRESTDCLHNIIVLRVPDEGSLGANASGELTGEALIQPSAQQ